MSVDLFELLPDKGLELAIRIEREKQVQKIYRYGAMVKIQAGVRGFLARRKLVASGEQDHRKPKGDIKVQSMLLE